MRMDTVLHIAFVDSIVAKNPDMLNDESKQIQQDPRTKSNFDKIISALQKKEVLAKLSEQDAANSQMTP